MTSIRIDNDTYDKIEALTKRHSYFKRSTVINFLLRAVLENFTDKEIYDMLCYWRHKNNVVFAKFEIMDELKVKK